MDMPTLETKSGIATYTEAVLNDTMIGRPELVCAFASTIKVSDPSHPTLDLRKLHHH